MPVIAAVLALGGTPIASPACHRNQLIVDIVKREGTVDLIAISGAVVSDRNLGSDCTIPALPIVTQEAFPGNAPGARRHAPRTVARPIELPGGHRATFELTWPYCPTDGRCVRLGSLTVSLGSITFQASVGGFIRTVPAGRFQFDQPPGHVAEGMAADSS